MKSVFLVFVALLVSTASMANTAAKAKGKSIFLYRCAVCHGNTGEGNGKMSALIKTPPPANLTISNKSNQYLREIISKGGAVMNRSEKMPPWGLEITNSELDSLVLFIMSLRDK